MPISQRSLIVLVSLFALGLLTPSAGLAAFTQSYQATGNLHVEVVGMANLNPPAMGTLVLSTPPVGTIKQAYLYCTQTNNTLGMTASFGAPPPPGGIGPHASEALLVTTSTYRWDVTNKIIAGVASYGFTITDANGSPIPVPGVALIVVWDDVSTEPLGTVTIVDGMKQVGENTPSTPETESMTFTTVPAGSTDVWIFTTDDDTSLGEVVSYNSTAIGGPLVGNLGLNATVLKMRGLSVMGSNTLSIFSNADHFSWVFGVTSVPIQTVPTDPSTWGRVKSLYLDTQGELDSEDE